MTKASQIQSGAKSPHSKTLARISEPSEVFLHRNYMKLRSYRDDLLKRLNNSEYAAEYLAQTLASADSAGFLVALKDVVDARGGGENLAHELGIDRPRY